MTKEKKKNIIKILLVIIILLTLFVQFIFLDKKKEEKVSLDKNIYNYFS